MSSQEPLENNKINILYVTLSLDIGGLEVLLLEFLKTLNREKFNPSVCVLQEKGRLIEEVRSLGIPVYSIPKKTGIDFSLSFKLRKLIKDKAIHIVHTHNSTPWLYSGTAVKMSKGVSLVHTKHSNIEQARKKLIKAERFISRFTDTIIADSKDVRDFMIEKQNIDSRKIRLIFNGIDTSKFNKQSRRIADGNKKIGIVGRLVDIKDHLTLINAFKLVNSSIAQSELLIIGDGPTRNNLEEEVKRLGLFGKVKFLGERRDIPELLSELDLFVLSSLDEGMPISLLEVMAAGLPVVATRVGGNPEVVLDGETGFLVEPKSPESLAEKILIVLKNAELRRLMGERGRNRVEKLFSINNTVKRCEEIYEAIVSRDKNPKIAVIGEFPPPAGGMAIQAKLLCEKLTDEGFYVNPLKRNYKFKGLLSWLGKIRLLRGGLGFVIFEFRLLKTLVNSEVLYILSNSFLNFYLYTVAPVIIGKLCGKKVIINYHGGSAEAFFTGKIHFLARWTLNHSDFITVPSEYLKNILQKLDLQPIVIPNILEIQKFDFKKRDKFHPRFIVTRHLESEYNVEMIIKAFSEVKRNYPDASLQIYGKGSQLAALHRLCLRLGISQAVKLNGEVKNDRIAELYSQADILLNGSNIDNLPVSILEAFACGLPVVSTNAGGIPYLVKQEETGLLVDLNDYRSMAQSILRLLRNPELGQLLAENARKSLEKYSWDNIKFKLLPILKYRKILPLEAKIYQSVVFHIFDLFRGRKSLQKLNFLRKSQYWAKDTLDDWQLKRLNELFLAAKENSPFYQERLRNIELPLRDLSALQDIPILTKNDIRQYKETIKCQNVPENLILLGKTGGSTGEPMHYYYDKRGRDWNRGSVYRSQEWSGTYLGEKSIQMTGSHYDLTEFDKLKWKIIFWLQRYKSLPVSFMNEELLKRYYHEVVKYKPTSIWGYSSGIYHFARFIEEKRKNTDFGFLKAIITSSETLFDFQRKKINEVFGDGKVFDHYGSREFYIASECGRHKGYHLHSEVVLVEVVDKDNRHKKPGEIGRILITDLSNLAFPFIRYEIGDVGALGSEEACACGITLPKLEKVEGRIADVIVLPDRILTPPNFTILLSDYEGIEQYQIIQKDKSQLIVKIVKNGSFKPEYERYIKDALVRLAGSNIAIKLEYVNEISLPASGKRRYIISEVSEVHL